MGKRIISMALVLAMALMLCINVCASDRTIFGENDRTKVTNTKKSPYSAVCNLTLNWSNGARTYGTGFLISSTKVATAAHCMYNRDNGARVTSITIAPGDTVSGHPYGTKTVSTASSFVYPEEYETASSGIPYDYGVIKLSSEFYSSTNGSPATLPLKSVSDLTGDEVTLVGFDKNTANMWECSGNIEKQSTNWLYYKIDALGGMSGSPILAKVSGKLYVVGIHAYGVDGTQYDTVEEDYNDYNKATRIKSASKTFLENA